MMLDCGMHDPAWFGARHRGQPSALSTTAGYARTGQGGKSRIDRGCMEPWTVQAVESVRVVDMTGISDHHVLVVDLSRRKLIEALRRSIAPLEAWALAS
ncbi:hypothetical protein ABZ543_35400 [Streptomyces roseifaciens]